MENICMTDITRRITGQILAVPKGKVSCYRDIALKAGLSNGARQTVRVLHSLSRKYELPWHRIIRADGRIGLKEGEGKELQISLLQAEGVEVSPDGRVDMERFKVKTERRYR
ncbi:MAG: MGMT family protein [Treponema sp.]|nr:MGMT family protein [Treponema sp.]